MLPLRVVVRMVAAAVMADSPTTRKVAEMLPCRESNLAVGVPSVMLRKRRGLRPLRCRIIACKMLVPEDCGANGSSSQEPRERRKLRVGNPHLSWQPHRPLMGSIIVNMFKPLKGALDGGVTTGSLWPEEDATTTADEVDASLVEEYAGGTGSKTESGAACPKWLVS